MATIQEAYKAACNAGFIKRDEFSEEAFGNMLQNDNNRRAYYDHVTKIDPTFYSKDYDTFSQNVLSALGQPAAKNSTNQPSNAPTPSQVQPTFWQSIGAHDPYPQKTAEGVAQFEREQQLQRESAATMPLSQQDKDRQAEIQRLQTEGIWGKPNGITMDIDKQTGLPTISQTKGDGMHLSIGATPANQDEIDRLKAEQPSYITREIKTPQDLYTSVSEAWAANTPDGQKAKAELDKTAQDTYNNLMADMNRQIAGLQQQVDAGKMSVEEAQKQALQIADDTNAIYEEEMQLAQNHFFNQMADANTDYLSQQTRLLGQKATNQAIADLNAEITPRMQQLEQEAKEISAALRTPMRAGDSRMKLTDREYRAAHNKEQELYFGAQQFLADAAKISNAAQKGQGFWKGLGNSLGDIDTWDFGISQLTRSADLKKVVEKYEKGEQLTDAEKGLMDSAVAYMSACAYNSDKLSRLYKAGQTTGESIPFMLQFAAMPIDAIKNKVAKGVLGYGIEQFGGKAAQAAGKAAAKYGAKTAFKEAGTALLSNLAAAGVQTAAFGVPKIAEGAISRMTGDIQPTLDEQGNIAYNGRQNQQSATAAVWNSTVDMYAENLSEMILTSLDPLKAYAGTTKLLQGLKSSQIAQVLGRLNEGVIGKVRDRAQFRNYLEEVSEEYVGNLIRWGLSTDVNNAEDAGFSADQQIDTWLGLAPTSIAFVGAGAINSAVSGGIDRFQSSRAAKRLREIMADGDKRKYLESLLRSRNSDDFSKNAHEVLKTVLRDKELNEDTKRLIMDGIYSTYQSQLAQEAEQARVRAEAERQSQPEQQLEQPAQQEVGQQTASAAENEANLEGEEHYQDADGNEVTFYRNADGSVSLRDENDNAAVDEHGNAVVLTQDEFGKYVQDSNLRRVDRELSTEQWAEREDELRQQYAAEIRPNTHSNGYVYEVVLASDEEKRGYIVGDGKVEIDDTTDPAVPRIANADVVTVRFEDGTMAQVAAKDLNLVQVDSAEQIVEDNLQPFQQYAQAMQTFHAGQEISMDDGSGKTYTSHVVSVSEDGVEVEIENAQGEPDTTIIPNEIALTALHPVEQKQPEQQVEKQEPFEFVKTDPFGNPIVVEQPEQIPTTPQKIVPNIDTMLADELGASVVEYLGDKASAVVYLEAERDKADAEVKRLAKQKVTRYTDIADFKRQNDELQAAKKAAADQYNKLQNAIATVNNYKTKVEQAAEAERKAREEERRATRRQTQTAQLANAAPAERWKAAPKVEGNAVTRTLPDGTVIKGHYVLVEAGAATPSHDPFNGWNTSNGFPVTEDGKNINDRDYKNDTDAQQITTQIAQTYDGQAVAQVPVVSSEGIVYDGNGRTIAGNIAAANNTDEAYIQALADNAGNFGFAPEQVAGMQHPRVYMQTDEDLPYNTTTFAKFNAQEKKSQGSTNRAVSSSKKLTEAARDGMLRILDNYGTLDAFFASETGAKDIVRSLLDNGIITQQEVAGLTENTDRGFVLSPAGKDYVTDLLIGGLFDEQTIRMLGNDKGLKQSILRAMPSIVENRRLGDYALTDNINNAIRLLYEARQAGMAYPLYVKQGNAFDGYVSDRFSPFEMLLAEEMSSGVETFRQVLNLYNNSARDEANGQTGLFEPRTFDDIKKEILQHYGKSTDQSAATAAESTQSRPANTQTEPPVPSTPTGDGQGIASTEQANSATEESSRPNGQAERSKANNRQKKSEKTPTGEQTEYNGSKEQSQSQQSENKIFTEDAYEAARRRMHERLNRLNAGLDPEMLSDGLIMAGYHVEKGARKFAEFAREMIREFGDKIRPYLKSFYNGLRDLPEAVELSKEMDDYGTVAQFDVNRISIEEPKAQNNKPNGLMEQYSEIKKQYPNALLLFRMGDDYELYAQDAVDASKILNIGSSTTNRLGEQTIFAKFPYQALDSFLPKLVRAGRQVAICDPIENIQTAKSGTLEVVTPQEMAESTEKSSETLPSNEKSVSSQSANAEDTQPIGKVTQSKHTKTGEDIWIVKPSERVSDDEFKLLKARAKANNGYYSSFAKNRGFIFKSDEDANNFNNISDEEITTDQTSADTETAVRTAETVVGETASITRDRRDSSRAEREPGTESIEGGVREPRNVELTPEQANEQVATRQQAIAKIDNANDKITDQLAVLGFYEADTTDPTKFNESYGYIKTAEAKAVKDIDRLAKQLADDLGVKVSKRKTIAKANIAPAGGDISFRLPLENGKELYLQVSLQPNFELNTLPYHDVSEDSLMVDGIMWRIEAPQASGMARYSLSNQYCREDVKYIDLLNDIRRKSKEYLPTIPAGTTKQEIAKQVAEKATRKKKDTARIADTQPMLDLFGDVAETMNEGAQQEQDGWNPQASTDEELRHGYNVGDKVQYQGKTAEIVGFDNGRLVLDLMGSGWNTKLARFDEVEPINTNNNGDTTEIRTDGRGENGTAQTEPTRQSRDENGTLGGSEQPQDERPVGRRVDTGSKPHRVHDGERSAGTPVQPTEQTVTQSEQTDIEPSQWRNTHNFHARGGERLAPTAPKARYEANLAAIRLLKQLQDEGRQATAQEKDILAQYSGWGGLGEFFKGEPGTTYYSQQGEQSPYQVLQSLLTDEELQAAQLSRNSAYYTPESVINSMWQVAERLGFKGGNILEGSAGIGNIFALMPSDISHRSNLTAVEIDDITAGILSQLYPDATTYHAGFQDVDIPNNSQDLVITNVPFVTGLHVYDKQEKDLSKRFGNIHDFCIAKNVRKLKQGGLGIFISSSGTLDNSKDLRVWLNNEGDADVIGAFRLNRETFGGTSATSDIIVVRKRVNGQKDPRSIDVLDTATDRIAKQPQDEVFDKYTNQFKKPADKEIKLVYNKYFVEHPLSMGGEMGFGFEHGDTRWGGTTAGCYPEPTINQSARLKDWIDSIEQSEQLPTYDELKQGAQVPNGTYETYEGAVPYGSLILNSKGEICKAYHGTAVPVEGINSNKVKGYSKSQVLKDYNAIKQAIDNLLQAQTKNVSDSELKPYLQQLNKVYDDFVRKYGNLNRNTSLAFLRNDVQWASVAAIEKVKETVDVNGKKKIQVAKTDLFSKRVVGVQAVPKAENTRDGIILSMQQFGTIRPDKIAEWLGKPTDEVEREIIGTRLGFRDPQTGNIQVRYEYLSGNVREKLAYAVEHNENGSLDANIEELRKVIPVDIPAHLIEFNIGSTWIPKELYLQYAKEKYDLDNLKLNHVGSAWVSNDVWGRNEKNRSEGVYSDMLGIQIYGHELMLAAMNNVPVVVSRVEKHSDGTSETRTDKVASAACSDKISQIKDDFVDWARGKMQQDSELADRIQKIYNDRFNAIVPMLKVDKEFLSEHLPGQNSAKYTLYPHQQQAVARGLTQALMLAHEVGTGKTISLISTAMEMRRLGTAKRPMIVVQNVTTQQFVADAKDLYPNAKILTVSDRDRTAEGRQEFYAKIKYNDWDLIIVPQSVFDMIPDSEARMRDFINEKIEEKMHAIEAAKEAGLDNNVTKRMERELGMLQEDLETNNMSGKRSSKKAKEKDAKKEAEQRANTEARAQAMLDRKTDDIENFDEIGIDALLIDEAHNYKHLGFATMMTRGVKGVDPSYSKRAAALYLKCQSIYERNGHKNVIFATGTPISNTAAEIWTFMKYLMPKQTLQENEIYYFDDFVHNFGKINEQLEFATNGKFKANNRFAQYGNVPELMRLWLSVADCTLTREVGQVNDKVPELEGGKAQDIFLPQSPSLIDIMSAVRAQLEEYENMSGKEKRENSHIPLTMYGIAKRAAIDPRLVDANAVDEPLSKTNRAVEEVLRSLNDSKKYKGTVAIFCDSYQNKQSGFNLFNDIKEKLTKQGVPANQIAIIRSEMSDSAKQKIFDAVREGDIRVIMGSTQTLGTGVNIQTRLHTLIHMDAPDRPMDYTQRNGRILRQGNMHKEWGIPVRVLRFGVEDSLDVTSYQRLKTKAGFIDSIMNGKSMIENNLENRVLEDVDEGIFDNPVAMLSGSQYALLKSQAERDLRKWSARAQQYRIDQILIAKKTKDNEKIIAYRKQKIADNEKLIGVLSQTFPDGKVSEYNINGTVCHTDEEVKNALKEVNKDVTTESDALRKDVYGSKKALSYPVMLNGVPFNVDIQLTRKVGYKDGQSIVSVEKEVLYSAPTLGIEPIASPTKVIDRLIDMIQDDIISGKQARDENAYSADYIKRLEKENALMRERDGKPFEHQAELEKAQTLVDEYTKKMQAELAEKEAKYANQSHNSVNLDKMDSEDDATDTAEAQYDELDYDIDNLTDAQQLDTDVLLGALDEAGISVERVSEEDAERELNSRQILEKSQKSTTFVPTSKVPKSELAVAHKALFAKVQDQSEAGIVYGVFSANYYHIFNGNQHQYAVRIEGNEDIISDIQKEIQYGTNKNANPLSQWVTDIQSGKGYDSRDNANATEQRGGDVDANALYGRQPTDSQRDNQESNGDSGITTPLRTTSGVIHGYAKDGKIYLTDKGFNPNTPIHEYTHLWVKAVRNNNAELYGNLRDLFSRENLPNIWNELDNDPQYSNLSDEAKLSEIIARFSGKRGAERMEQETQKLIDDAKQEGKRAVADAVSFRERMRNLLRRFWNWVGEHLFHIKHFGSREEAADRVLYDLLNATDLHQPSAEKDSQAEFSTSPMPKRIEGEMVHEWARRIAEWKRQQVDEQQVAEYAKLLKQNDSKKSKLFAQIVDKFTPIDNFQQWVQAQGGVYDEDTMDMHSDISLALGRIETFSRRYKNDYMQRIADSIAQIAKDNRIAAQLLALGLKWQNFDNKNMNGKPLTVREIMGVYAQAKDTWEAEQQGLSDRGAQGFVKNLGASHTDIIEAVERIIPQEQLDEFWNAVYAANQFALDYQLNAGMIDPGTRSRYTRRYYVPQRGWRERDFDGIDNASYVKDNGTRLYGNPYNAALVKAHGRESLASDPFALIESIGLTSINQSEHNKSKQQLFNLLLANERLGLKSGAWRVKQVWSKNVIDPRTGHIMRKPDGTPVQAEVTYAAPTQQEREHDADINASIDQLRKELRDLTQPAARAKRETEIANLQDQLIYTGRATDTMLEHRTRDERMQHQVVVLKDGQQYIIELQDARLANAVNGNFGEAWKAYTMFNKLNAPAIRYVSGMLTQYNPRFAHRNFWRDVQAAFLNNLSEQGLAFTTRAMANIPAVQRTVWQYILADTYKNKESYGGQFGDYLREYFEAGAQTGFSFMPELERMAKDFNKMVKGENTWDKVWGKGVKGTLSLMTEASELTVRFAEYVTARQMGRSVQEAAKLAKNISVNFNQSGLMSKEMSKFFTFFNATIQGNMRFLMPYGKNKPKFGEKAFKFGAKFAGTAANFLLLGFVSTWFQPDDPDDDTWFTEYDRMSNFILFGKVKIPVVHFFRMYYAAGVQAALAAQGHKTWKDAFYTSTDYALGELVPTSALQIQNLWDYDETTNTLEFNPAKYAQAAAPSVISPLVDVAVNRDFKGATVYRKKWDNDKKDITTAKRNTPQWAIDVSNTLHRWSGGNPDVPYKGGNTDGWIDIKPNAIEHIAQGYLSGVWESLGHTTGFIWDGAHDPDVYKHATNWPFLRDLFRDYNEEKAYNQQYYSVLQKLEKYEKRVNTLSKNEFNAEKQTNRFQTFKQVSKQLRRLPNPYNDEETTVTSEDVNKILQLDIELNRNLFTD
jgi:N12 class adenine-specific DNA methylase